MTWVSSTKPPTGGWYLGVSKSVKPVPETKIAFFKYDAFLDRWTDHHDCVAWLDKWSPDAGRIILDSLKIAPGEVGVHVGH
jgi:hypothetical protein